MWWISRLRLQLSEEKVCWTRISLMGGKILIAPLTSVFIYSSQMHMTENVNYRVSLITSEKLLWEKKIYKNIYSNIVRIHEKWWLDTWRQTLKSLESIKRKLGDIHRKQRNLTSNLQKKMLKRKCIGD